MVGLIDKQQTSDTKPHRPDYQADTQTIKAARDFVARDSQPELSAPEIPVRTDGDPASAEVTQPVPEDAGEQQLVVLSKVLSETPEHPQARRYLYTALQRYLSRYPFLRYLEESDSLYQVITGGGRVVVVPKDRAIPESYPSNVPVELRMSYRWLSFAVLGLLSAGLATMICAPIAAMFAWRASLNSPGNDQRKRAGMALIYAGTLWAVGLVCAFLFVLHLL